MNITVMSSFKDGKPSQVEKLNLKTGKSVKIESETPINTEFQLEF